MTEPLAPLVRFENAARALDAIYADEYSVTDIQSYLETFIKPAFAAMNEMASAYVDAIEKNPSALEIFALQKRFSVLDQAYAAASKRHEEVFAMKRGPSH